MTWTGSPGAGAKLRASVLSALITEQRPIRGRCSSTLTKNNNTTLADITGAAVAVEANKTYYMWAGVQVNGNGTADFKVGWTYPSGLTMSLKGEGFNTGGVYISLPCAETDVRGWGAGAIAGGTDDTVLYEGWVFVGSTAGTLQMQGAQQTANVSDTVFKTIGTYIIIRQSE